MPSFANDKITQIKQKKEKMPKINKVVIHTLRHTSHRILL